MVVSHDCVMTSIYLKVLEINEHFYKSILNSQHIHYLKIWNIYLKLKIKKILLLLVDL